MAELRARSDGDYALVGAPARMRGLIAVADLQELLPDATTIHDQP